jgi:hypothetical protein
MFEVHKNLHPALCEGMMTPAVLQQAARLRGAAKHSWLSKAAWDMLMELGWAEFEWCFSQGITGVTLNPWAEVESTAGDTARNEFVFVFDKARDATLFRLFRC